MPTFAWRNLAQVDAGRLGELGGVVAQLLVPRQVGPEDLADLRAVAVDGRDEEMRGAVPVELDDQLGEVGLDR